MCCVDQPHAREIPELLAHQSESVCAIRTSASTRSLPVSWGRPLRPVAFQNRRVNQARENCASYVIYVIVCLRTRREHPSSQGMLKRRWQPTDCEKAGTWLPIILPNVAFCVGVQKSWYIAIWRTDKVYKVVPPSFKLTFIIPLTSSIYLP